MHIMEEVGIQILVGGVAFLSGLIANRLILTAWIRLRSRHFWGPIASKDLGIVLGEGFSSLASYEATGLIGRGDLMAGTELISHLSAMGLRRLRPEFADKAEGVDPSGKGLRRNLIIVGGKDANLLTKACLMRLRCSYDLNDDPQGDTPLGRADVKTWNPPRLEPTRYAVGETRTLTPIIEHDRLIRDYGVIVRTTNPFLLEGGVDKRIVVIYGCYGLGSHAAAIYSTKRSFLDLVKDSEEDIECIISCDAVGTTPQAIRKVFVRTYPRGTLCMTNFLDGRLTPDTDRINNVRDQNKFAGAVPRRVIDKINGGGNRQLKPRPARRVLVTRGASAGSRRRKKVNMSG